VVPPLGELGVVDGGEE
jgi:hypothetical protein